MRVCPSCGFRKPTEGGARLELCPRCRADGKPDSYLVPERSPTRRHDLIGLLATARGELNRGRSTER